jgi:hypothetical protein
VEIFALPEDMHGMPAYKSRDPSRRFELGLAWIGLRFEDEGSALRFAIVSHEPATVPGLTMTEIYLDTDDDGRDDRRLRYGAMAAISGGRPSNIMGYGIAPWDPDTGQTAGPERLYPAEPAALHSRVSSFKVPLAELGLTRPGPLGLGVLRRGLTEDWYFGPDIDQAPPGMLALEGRRYRLDPESWPRAPSLWSFALGAAGIDVEIALIEGDRAPADGSEPTWLAVYPDDDGHRRTQAQMLPEARVSIAYLPLALRRY